MATVDVKGLIYWLIYLRVYLLCALCRRCNGREVYDGEAITVGRWRTSLHGERKSHPRYHAWSGRRRQGDPVRWRVALPGGPVGLGGQDPDCRVHSHQQRRRPGVLTVKQHHLQRHRWAIRTCRLPGLISSSGYLFPGLISDCCTNHIFECCTPTSLCLPDSYKKNSQLKIYTYTHVYFI